MAHGSKVAQLRRGWVVFLGLGLLTIVEYWVATSFAGALPYLAVIALIKAWLVIQYFMHVAQLWNTAEEEE